MPRKRFTNEQIASALRQAENGVTVDETCRKMGVSEPTFYDNAKAKSFMKTLEVEWAYPMAFESFADVADELPRFNEEVYSTNSH